MTGVDTVDVGAPLRQGVDQLNEQAASEPRARSIVLHGRDVSFLDYPGTGTPLVLLHGVGSSADGWQPAAPMLAATGSRVLAIDLPGHGESSKQPGDYSLGSLASTVRDLLDALGIERAVLIGHSLGGGVALQFQYQFPSYCAGLVLVSSGGLGADANLILRLATLPGSGIVLRAALNPKTTKALTAVRSRVHRVTGRTTFISDRALSRIHRLSAAEGRNSFLATLRSVVDFSGQRVSALEKLYLSNAVPVLIIWGEKDAIIPADHGRNAHDLLESSTLVLFEESGHEPHRTEPRRFVDAVLGWRARSEV